MPGIPRSNWLLAAGLTLAFLSMSQPARSGVVTWRDRAQAEPSLTNLWTFEGGQPLAADVGTENLAAVTGGGTGPTIAPSFDNQGSAGRSFRVVNPGGFRTPGNVALATSGTVEYLFRPDDNLGGHIVSVNASSGRLYFGLNDGTGFSPDPPAAAVGFGNGAWPSPRADFLQASTAPDFETGHWYYTAVTYDLVGGPNRFVFDVYVADLTEGQTTLTHAVAGETRPAANTASPSGRLGIGLQGGSGGNFFEGTTDEVAAYSSKLTAATLQEHLDAIHSKSSSSTILTANQDTYINVTGDTSFTHGSEELLRIGNGGPGGNGTKEGLVQFDLSGLSPGLRITRATFQAIQTDIGIGAGFDVFEVTSPWDEATASGDTAPSTGDHLGLMTVNSSNTLGGFSSFSSLDLTDLVQAWYDGSKPNFGLNLKINGSSGDTLASTENLAGRMPPQLVVEFATPEPSALLLFGLGMLTFLATRRSSRHTP